MNKTIGEQIAFLRKREGMTQKELARKADIRQSTLSLIETGSHFHTRSLHPLLDVLGAEVQLCTSAFPEGAGKYEIRETVQKVG